MCSIVHYVDINNQPTCLICHYLFICTRLASQSDIPLTPYDLIYTLGQHFLVRYSFHAGQICEYKNKKPPNFSMPLFVINQCYCIANKAPLTPSFNEFN